MKLLRVFVCLAGAVAIALVVSAPVAEAQLQCGAEIWEDTKLTEDLYCTDIGGFFASALFIKGDNVTLDLGGHTIFGPQGPRRSKGVNAAYRAGVTIKNGTITGFNTGVLGRAAHDLEVKNLLFTDQTHSGVSFGFGAKGVEIKDSTFIDSEVAIFFGDNEDVPKTEDISIKNIDATRCYYCVIGERGTNVEVKDSSFHDIGIALGMWKTPGLKISGNYIGGECVENEEGECWGVTIEEASEIKVTNNFVSHGDWGIRLHNIVDSEISSNHVYNNADFGIGIFDYSTGNKIESNITFGNGIDLMHDCSSSPNKWEDNSWETCQGTDINGCTNPCTDIQ